MSLKRESRGMVRVLLGVKTRGFDRRSWTPANSPCIVNYVELS